MSRVSKLWCTLAADPQLWKNLVEAKWDTRLLENSKPDHKHWKWLYECKSVRLFVLLLLSSTALYFLYDMELTSYFIHVVDLNQFNIIFPFVANQHSVAL